MLFTVWGRLSCCITCNHDILHIRGVFGGHYWPMRHLAVRSHGYAVMVAITPADIRVIFFNSTQSLSLSSPRPRAALPHPKKRPEDHFNHTLLHERHSAMSGHRAGSERQPPHGSYSPHIFSVLHHITSLIDESRSNNYFL